MIDRDIDDAPVAGANGAKIYSSWTLNLIDYPTSPPDTAVYGINDANLGGDANGNYVPPIFTEIYCRNGCVDGEPDIGYYWQGGNFISVDQYLNGETKPCGVNNLLQIVGHYYPYPGVVGPEQGFLFTTMNGVGSASPLNYPNAVSTLPYGINDASQIVGSWADTSNGTHAFIETETATQETWTSIDRSGGNGTVFAGINGIGQIAGHYGTHGFVYSAVDGWTNIDCKGASSTNNYRN